MPSVLKIIALAAGCAMLAACSSTTNGSGAARQPSAHPSSSSETSEPSDTPAPTDSDTASPTTPAPTEQPPPPQCPGGTCTTVATANLGNGFMVALRSGPPTDGSAGASIVELTLNGLPIYWYAADGETPASLTCKSAAKGNCLVVDYVGAHGSTATVWTLVHQTLQRGDVVNADTPSMFGRDLNGDGNVDAIGLQNNYNPDYVTGKVQWQTWLSDSSHLTSTGCTPLKSTAGPRPSTAVTGKCAPI